MAKRASHAETTFPDAHADWECGRTGEPCRFGPDAAGRCAQRAECTPYRDGDRWRCDRPIGRGGPCEAGPLPDGACCKPATPCVPRMTPRRRFKTATRIALLFSIAAALLLLSSRDALLPGPVASGHASFEGDCEQCHADVSFSLTHMVAATFGDNDIANARKCLTCHAVGDAPLAAHGVGGIRSSTIAASSSGAGDAPLGTRAAALIAPSRLAQTGDRGRLACNLCHREHEGRDAAVATLTDAQCQICHSRPFDGFADHPTIENWPHHRDSQIAFDHASHFRRHFPAAEKDGVAPPTQCIACHNADRAGNFTVGGFDACASCHASEITEPRGDTPFFTFLAPPGLDLEALAEAGIGAWPEYAEAAPTEFTRLGLRASGYLRESDWNTIAPLDLLDLLDATPQERAAAARFAWAFKALSRDLLNAGPAALVEAIGRFEAKPSDAVEAADWSAQAASLSFEVAAGAVRAWFPDLEDELARHAAGAAVPTRAVDTEAAAVQHGDAAPVEDWLRFGGWHATPLALQYRPTGHADRFMHGWLAFAESSGARGEALLQLLSAKDAAGRCAKCHVDVDRAEPNARRLHWRARNNLRAVNADSNGEANRSEWPRARRFSHRSHQRAIAANGCASCHALLDADAAGSASGLAALPMSDCAACHRQDAALGECATCHLYHFENFEARLFEQQAGLLGKEP